MSRLPHALRQRLNRLSPWSRIIVMLAVFWLALAGVLVVAVLLLCGRAEARELQPVPGALDRARTTTPVDVPLAINFTLINGRADVFGCQGGTVDEARLLFNWFERNRIAVRFVDDAASACNLALARPNVCWTRNVDWLFHRVQDPERGWRLATQDYAGDIPAAILRDLPRTWPQWSDRYHPDQIVSGPRAAALLDAPLCY